VATFFRDIRYGTRLLMKNPGFAAAAVVCLALGIGATSAIFSVVHAILLNPWPIGNPTAWFASIPNSLHFQMVGSGDSGHRRLNITSLRMNCNPGSRLRRG